MKRAFYPPLLAAFLVLALFNANSHQLVSASVVWLPLLISVGGVCILWALGRLILKRWDRAALPVCILTIMFLEYGHLRGALGLSNDTTLKLWVAAFALATIAVAFLSFAKKPPTVVLNAVAAGLVLSALVPFGTFALNTPSQTAINSETTEATISLNLPDIYYIIPDEYSRGDILLDMCNFDNSNFLDYLRGRGFNVAENSYASYPATSMSLASTLNMNYLPFEEPLTVCYLTTLVHDSEVGRQVRQAGYTLISLNTYWSIAAELEGAEGYDRNSFSDFTYLIYDTSLFGTGDPTAQRYYNYTVYQFSMLKEISKRPEPTFTILHTMITHAPYICNPDGSFRGDLKPTGEHFLEAYNDQITAMNTMLQKAIETILDQDNTIIIIQSDNGTQPHDYLAYIASHNKTLDNVAQENPYIVWTRLATISAIYTDCDLEFTSSHVNTFRVIFNHYLGTDYQLLPDRYFFGTRGLDAPYTLVEVTNALEEYINEK